MKGSLLTPIRYVENNKKTLETLIKAFQNKNHTVESSVLQVKDPDLFSMSEKEVKDKYNRIQKELRHTDFIVAEITEPSSGIGFMLGQAVQERKPILVLRNKEASTKGPIPLRGNKNKLIHYEEYDDNSDFDKIVDNFVEHARSLMDTKFILIISPEIDKYLEWAGSERRMHKAQIVRNAVEATMENDADYQKFLKQQTIAA